jgi:hypothetical protein
VILFVNAAKIQSQTKSNLEIFYKMADSAAISAAQNIPLNKNDVKVDLGTGTIFSVFNNQIIASFQKSGKNILSGPKNDSSSSEISFIIDKANVNYSELFQEKLFGDFYTQRQIAVSGNYVILPGIVSHNFSYSYRDTVNTDEIKNIENNALSFTQGKVPAEPLFSSIYEPIIVTGAAALTVILFFTIRSK